MEKITFEELRSIKDALPHGSMQKIADSLGIEVDTVRNYFGGTHYNNGEGKPLGLHIEPGPNGGVVILDDDTILRKAKEIIKESNK